MYLSRQTNGANFLKENGSNITAYYERNVIKMINAFYTGETGLSAYQRSLDNVANNLANTDTTGYKAQGTSFTDLLYQNINTDTGVIQSGTGTKISNTYRDFSLGASEYTGRVLDFSINGDGFFAVADGDGNISYTRDGSFNLSTVNGKKYLVTDSGDYVLDDQRNPVVISGDEDELVFTSLQSGSAGTVTIGVFGFDNPYALQSEGGNKFSANDTTGETKNLYGTQIVQQSLERSNTNTVNEMHNLIVSQRSFQFSAKLIQTADEIEQIINSLR